MRHNIATKLWACLYRAVLVEFTGLLGVDLLLTWLIAGKVAKLISLLWLVVSSLVVGTLWFLAAAGTLWFSIFCSQCYLGTAKERIFRSTLGLPFEIGNAGLVHQVPILSSLPWLINIVLVSSLFSLLLSLPILAILKIGRNRNT